MESEQLQRNIQEQRELYGASLVELLAPVRAVLGITQARLAQVMGLSAPMLSQLLQGQRVKIGNPVVLTRMDALVQLASEAEGLQVHEREQRVEEIAAARARTTQAVAPANVRDALLAIAPESQWRSALDTLTASHPVIAAGLARPINTSEQHRSRESTNSGQNRES